MPFFPVNITFVCVLVQIHVASLQCRRSHCVAVFSLSPGMTEIIIHSKTADCPTDNDETSETLILRFGKCKLLLYSVIKFIIQVHYVIENF